MTCTFFGHADAPENIEKRLCETLTDLIVNKNVDMFYVGNQGNFDHTVKRCLKLMRQEYPHISYSVVLAYMPVKRGEAGDREIYNTLYPDGLENTPLRFAISKRNRWMIDRSDLVVTYVKYTVGGAARFEALAKKMGKTVINLAEFK